MDKSAVRQVLRTLPKDLHETYDRILRGIPHTCVHNAIKLLQLLVFSKRPLLLEEVVDAIATKSGVELPFSPENRIDPPSAIIGYCPSLVRITTTFARKYNNGLENEYKVSPEDTVEVIITMQLAHFSVQEYLLLERKETIFHESFTEQVANARITRICLAYLWAAAEDIEAQQSISGLPFVVYAAREWLEHAKIAGDNEEATFICIRRLFTNEPLRQLWWTLYNHNEVEHFPPTLALYFASLSGLCRTVKHLLEAGANVNGAGGRHGNALQAACRSGSIDTVRMLVNHGADVNPEDGDQCALHAAASTGNVEVLYELLNSGASVNAVDIASRTALFQASQSGQVEVVRTLLEHGADVNLRSIFGTALQEAFGGPIGTDYPQALRSDHTTIVQLLLDHGADVNGHPRGSSPVFSLACASGDAELVRMLLDYGAVVNADDGWYGTAVSAAAYYGHRDVVQILVDRGADINAQGGRYGPALLSACSPAWNCIDAELVRYLLDNGADPNARGSEYSNALCAACIVGDAQVVDIGRMYDNALCLTIRHGHVEVLRVLLDNGADPNAIESEYSNALCAASRLGNAEVVKLLLQRGANVHATSGKYGNALYIAARHGHVEVLRVVLDNGGTSNAHGKQYYYALVTAMWNGHAQIAEMLLEEGAKRHLAIMNANPDSHPKVRHVCDGCSSLAYISSALHQIHVLPPRQNPCQMTWISNSLQVQGGVPSTYRRLLPKAHYPRKISPLHSASRSTSVTHVTNQVSVFALW
jgi:ankyrin repeat protein